MRIPRPLAVVVLLAACAPDAETADTADAASTVDGTAAADSASSTECPARPARDTVPLVWTAAEVAAAVDTLPGADTTVFLHPLLADRGGYTLLEVRRTASGAPEQHTCWDDVMMVQEGAGTLNFGGTLTGAAPNPALGPGEWIGGTLTGSRAKPLAPGDMVVMPAGIPHQVTVADGGMIRYAIVKAPPPR